MLLTRCCHLIGQPNIPGWDTKTCRECPDVFFRADSPRPLVIRACVHVGKIRLARETVEDDDARIAKLVCVEFSYEALKVRRGPLGLCIGTYGPLECSGEFLKPS